MKATNVTMKNVTVIETPYPNLNGKFRKVFRDNAGMYGFQTITFENGIIKSIEETEPTMPQVALHRFGRDSFDEANNSFKKVAKVEQ